TKEEGRPMQLVINTLGACLRKQSEQFQIVAGEKKLTLSAHKVQSILVTTGVMITSDALELALAHNIDVVFLDRHGEPLGRVWPAKMGSTAAIRRRQIEVAEGPEGLALAREWIAAKLRHQTEFLGELQHRRPDNAALFDAPLATIGACREQVERLT